MRRIAAVVGAALLAAGGSRAGQTVGDLVRVRGIRSNPLVGIGLVVGLKGTGDTSPATREAVRRLAAARGFEAAEGDPDATGPTNAALVVVTADLPPFAAEGARVDVTVSATGDAASIAGGTLVATPLGAGSAKEVYVRAQGPVLTGDPAKPATVGVVHGGGIVERAAPPAVLDEFVSRLAEGRITLDLREASAEAAAAIADGVNRGYTWYEDAVRARAATPGEVEVSLAQWIRADAVRVLGEILALPVELAPPARVVVSERLGTVAASGRIGIAPATVKTGSLFVTIAPAKAKAGEATPAPAPEGRSLAALGEGVTLEEIVRELHAIQATPQDVIEVLRGLARVGALGAEIVVE